MLFFSFIVNAQRPVVYKTNYGNYVYSNIEKHQIKYLHELFSVKTDLSLEGYVKVGNGFSRTRSKEQFLRLFGDRSTHVRKYMKESGINICKADKMQISVG